MSFDLKEFKRLAEKRTFVLADDAEFLDYCGNHADAIVRALENNTNLNLSDAYAKADAAMENIKLRKRIEKLEKAVEALKAWCKDDPKDSYSEKLHEALEELEERGE